MRKVFGFFVLMFLLGCNQSCQPAHAPVQGDASPLPAGSPVGLGAVAATGTCDAAVSLDLLLGPVILPLSIRAQTSATAGGATTGHVGVDLAGLLTARCAISPASPEGLCAVGGLAPRLLTPAPIAEGQP